jgi:hypothetical protein
VTIVNENCKIIWEELKAIVMPIPLAGSWRLLSNGFINGISQIVSGPQMEHMYFNWYISIVLLDLIDANSKFIAVDVDAHE